MYADETTDEWDDDEIMSQGSVDGSNEFEEDMQNVVGDDCSSDDMADTQAQQPKHNVDNSMVLMLLSLASSKISVQSKSADALLGAFGQLRERALGVINNILLLGLSENLNSPTAQFIWDALIAIVNDKCDSGILEAAVTAAWSLSQASCDMIVTLRLFRKSVSNRSTQ